jgi:hypothetical protein
LRKLVLFAQAQFVCPIVSISLPPCSSVPSFVIQVTFLAHLFPLLPRNSDDNGKYNIETSDGTNVNPFSQRSAAVKKVIPFVIFFIASCLQNLPFVYSDIQAKQGE